jgi:hypothetical protein
VTKHNKEIRAEVMETPAVTARMQSEFFEEILMKKYPFCAAGI